MKKTRLVVGCPRVGTQQCPKGRNSQTFSSTMAARIKSPEKLPIGREREGECTDCPGAALWSSVFAFLIEGLPHMSRGLEGRPLRRVPAVLARERMRSSVLVMLVP